jgi:hypothetical protein
MQWFANKGQVVQVIAAILSGLAAIAVLINVSLTGGKVGAVLLVIVTCGFAGVSVIMFFRNRAQDVEKATTQYLLVKFLFTTCHMNPHWTTAGHCLKKMQRDQLHQRFHHYLPTLLSPSGCR